MAVELRPLGVKCNIQCQYCYQNPQRDAGNVLHAFDVARMKAAVEAEGGPIALFGGEPLLVPLPVLEDLLAWGLAKYGRNSVQTNGTLITDAHLDLFRRYKVEVGLSIDGPGWLNDARWGGTVERTRELTGRVEAVINQLCREGTPPNLIITLHRGNATAERLPDMRAWLKDLEARGVRSARLHLLEVDHDDVRATYALTATENRAAVRSFADLQRELTTLRLDLFEDVQRMLLGHDSRTTCVWNACDPYTTRAVRGVEGSGQRTNCGRTNKEGIEFTKAGVEGFERYISLYHTPREFGGCQGCRFFLMCKGQCPGTALGNDWRNRSEHCEVWMDEFERTEAELVDAGREPLSLSPRRQDLENYFLEAWGRGYATTLEHALATLAHQPAVTTHSTAPRAPGPMGLLPFSMPQFTRVAWVGDEACDVWGPRLGRVRAAWAELEWRTVAAGVRACGIVLAAPHPSPWGGTRLSELRLDDQSTKGRVAIGRPADLDALARALAAEDDETVGQLLGIPACCRAVRRQAWADGLDDLTWLAAVATPGAARSGRVVDIAGPPQSNPLLGWFGLRPALHAPCRFDCPATVALADRVADVARSAGFGVEAEWLREMLDWPAEWSALHGIAEVRLPVLKISTRTDTTAEEYVVRRQGVRYPAEGGRGLRFPYRQGDGPLLTLSLNYRRGLAHASGLAGPAEGVGRDDS